MGFLSIFTIARDTKTRNVGLDVMRAVGFMLVLLGHSMYLFKEVVPGIMNYFYLFRDAIELFFVLSGFLIGNMLIKEYEKKGAFNFVSVKNFLIRRWFKTLPPYYVVIALHLLLGWLLMPDLLKDFSIKFLFFLQNIKSADFFFFPISYSLSIEEWFYLLFPLGMAFSLLVLPKFPLKHMVPVICLLFIIAATLMRVKQFHAHYYWDAVLRKSVLTRIDASIYGIIGSWIYYYKREFFEKFSTVFFVISILIFFPFIYYAKTNPETFITHVLYFNIVPICFMLMLPGFYYLKPKANWFNQLSTHISMVSYSFYLVHLTPILFILLYYWKPASIAEAFGEWAIYLVLVIIATHLLYKFVEEPALRWRERCERIS
jgi:peptidoglycan/LPS O-acetylase OafA/YrhL